MLLLGTIRIVRRASPSTRFNDHQTSLVTDSDMCVKQPVRVFCVIVRVSRDLQLHYSPDAAQTLCHRRRWTPTPSTLPTRTLLLEIASRDIEEDGSRVHDTPRFRRLWDVAWKRELCDLCKFFKKANNLTSTLLIL